MKYELHYIFGVFHDAVPGQTVDDRIAMPSSFYKKCWLDRFLNRWVTAYRIDEAGKRLCVFYWPARKMSRSSQGGWKV